MLTQEEADEVIELIALHGEIHKDREAVERRLKDKPSWFQHLLELSRHTYKNALVPSSPRWNA